MSYPWSKEILDEEAQLVSDLISKAISRMEGAVDDIQEACQQGGRLTANDAFRLSGQILHMKNAIAITREIYDSLQPEPAVPTLDEEGELDGKA